MYCTAAAASEWASLTHMPGRFQPRLFTDVVDNRVPKPVDKSLESSRGGRSRRTGQCLASAAASFVVWPPGRPRLTRGGRHGAVGDRATNRPFGPRLCHGVQPEQETENRCGG